MAIYDITLQNLKLCPAGSPAAILMRHSVRYPILSVEEVYEAQLTPEGMRVAEEFGAVLGKMFKRGRIFSNAVERCVNTGIAIANGARWRNNVAVDSRLSYAYVSEAWEARLAQETSNGIPPEVVEIVASLLNLNHRKHSVDLYITHDSVLACVVSYLLDIRIDEDNWPEFLEGAVFWREGAEAYVAWRGEANKITQKLSRVSGGLR
ncbi:MAG: histidine phosphatase family protein [Anaerolineae bacterium]|nr:histidine phosphatase family protein [Anaerolineae bacterium]